MKIIMIAATSSDEYIADSNKSYVTWTSLEDKQHFQSMLDRYPFGVMGHTTFLSQPLINPKKSHHRVVLTHAPNQFAHLEQEHSLEFRSFTPLEFVRTYEKNYKTCLLLGGSQLYTDFLEAELVNEIYLTIEPITLNDGIPLLLNGEELSDFTKHALGRSSTPLNATGTILEHFILKK